MATARQDSEENEDRKDKEITRLEGGNLRIDHDALQKVFMRPELQGKKFAVISITGKMRNGKSFLMNFVLRYLRHRGWENRNWMGDDDFAVDVDGLPFVGGTEQCTLGIRIYDEIFEVPVFKEKMMVMLMDTQGLFDNKTPEVVNKALLTLATLMCSVQIFNSKENIDSQSMEYLKTCVDFALRTAKASAIHGRNSEGYMKLQNLMFLVRDFPDEEDGESYGAEVGNKYFQDILNSNEGGEELKKIRARIKQSFENVECFAMPHPGMKATKRKFLARNRDLDDDFRFYVKEFVEHIANPRNLEPKRSSTKTVTPREMLNMIAACDTIFAERMINAQNMMKMNEKAYYSTLCQEAVMTYDSIMKESVHVEDNFATIEKKHKDCKRVTIERLEVAEFVGEEDTYNWKQHFLEHFTTQCNDHFINTVRDYENQKQKISLETRRAFLEYESCMKKDMFKPLSEEDFKRLHAKHHNAVVDKYADLADMNTLFNGVTGIYENLKEENKHRRETAERERAERQREEKRLQKEFERMEQQKLKDQKLRDELQQKIREHQQQMERKNALKKLGERLINVSQKNWDEFIVLNPNDVAMQRKREEISSKLSSEFLKEAGRNATVEHQQLLGELNRNYEAAKRKNEQNWNLEKRRIENAVDKFVLIIKETYNKKLVDTHFSEFFTELYFHRMLKISPEKIVDVKSERAKEYFIEVLHSRWSEAKEEILEKNRKYKPSNNVQNSKAAPRKKSSSCTLI